MCGICGKVSFTAEPVEPALLESMCAALVHRGPDGQGVHAAGPAGLGQRRLSVIDLSPSGVAPLPNEDATIWVTLNGEIYNYRELSAGLAARGHVFRTRTDTEVLVHLYEELGAGMLARLRGMFALAIWDAPRGQLLVARDRLGKKPLFYARTRSGFVFASSLAALLRDPGVTVAPDYGAIDQYLTRQYVPSPATAFEGVRKLPAGHYLTCGADGAVDVRRYWQPPLVRQGEHFDGTPGEIAAALREQLREAVRVRLVADVPVGAFLSGGVDSSAVVALMAQESERRPATFSIGFEEREFDELPYARLVARRYGTEHHEFVVRPDAAAVLPDLVRHYGEPFADSSALPMYYLSKLARQHVTVALSGDGGDEGFCGYENYRIVQDWGRADVVPAAIRRTVGAAVGATTSALPYHHLLARAERGAAMLAADPAGRFRLQTTILKPAEKRAGYTAAFASLVAGAAPQPTGPIPEDVDLCDWMMAQDLQHYLPDCLMVKVDVASMAHSLEVRTPLLDHQLIEFAARIPPRLKRDAGGGKRIFKQAVADLVPAETLDRRKTGFGVPLRRWFGRELMDLVRGTLLDDRARRRGLLDQGFTRRLVDDQAAGRGDWSHRLWALVCLELWFREFID